MSSRLGPSRKLAAIFDCHSSRIDRRPQRDVLPFALGSISHVRTRKSRNNSRSLTPWNRGAPFHPDRLDRFRVDLASAADSPYYDFTAAYDAYNQQTAASTATRWSRTPAWHGHGATVADSIVRAFKRPPQPGATTADVKIMPIRDTSSGLNIDSNALIRGVYWAADHGAAVINLSVNYYAADA